MAMLPAVIMIAPVVVRVTAFVPVLVVVDMPCPVQAGDPAQCRGALKTPVFDLSNHGTEEDRQS